MAGCIQDDINAHRSKRVDEIVSPANDAIRAEREHYALPFPWRRLRLLQPGNGLRSSSRRNMRQG